MQTERNSFMEISHSHILHLHKFRRKDVKAMRMFGEKINENGSRTCARDVFWCLSILPVECTVTAETNSALQKLKIGFSNRRANEKLRKTGFGIPPDGS